MKGTVVNANGYLIAPSMSDMVSRREAFIAAIWAGLAAPAMLFAAPTSYILYDGASGLQQAWGDVGRRVSSAVQADGSKT